MLNGLQTDLQPPPTRESAPASAGDPHRGATIRIAGTYFGVGLLWIWLTDLIVMLSGEQSVSGFVVSAGKGTLFVCTTTALVYWLVRRGFHAIGRANALLRAITDGTTDAMFVKDRDGKYLLFNRAAAGFVGKPVSAVLGRDDTALFDPEGARHVMERDRQVMATGRVETREEVLTAAGETRVYLATKAPYRDESGNVVGLIGISRDITDRKKAETAIREQEVFARSVLDSMAAHVAVLNADGAIVAVNESWRVFAEQNPAPSGPAPRTGVGTNYLGVCDESAGRGCTEAATAAAGIRGVLDGSTDRFAIEYPCHSPNEPRWFAMKVTRFAHAAGVVVAHTNITERKLAEDETRASREMLRLVLDNIPQGVFWKDRDSRFLGCNLVVARAMGLATPDAIAGRTHADLPSITPDQAAYFSQKDREVMDAGEPQHHILEPMTLADGRTIWLDTNKIPMRDAGGRVIGILGTWEDITERKQSEAVLNFQYALLRSQAEASPDGILVVSPDNRVLSYNRRFVEVWDIPEELVAAGDDAPVLALARSRTADPDGFAARVAAVYADADAQSHDEVLLADGRTLDRYSGPVRGAAGERFGRVWFFRDISDRKRTEAALRESETTLRLFVEHVPSPIAMFDRDMRYLHASRRWMTDYQLGDRDVTGQSHYDAFPDLPERWKATHRRCLAGAVERSDEDRFERADGSVLWNRWEARPWTLDNGRVGGILIFSEDITARKSAEQALRDRDAKLREQDAMLREAGELAHVGGWRFDPVTLTGDWTAETARIHDVEPSAGSSVAEGLSYYVGDDRATIEAAVKAAVEHGTPYDLELRLRSARGVEKWVRTICRPVAEGGRVTCVRGSIQDITEQKRAARLLQDRERLLRIVTASARVGLAVVDEHYQYQFANEAYADIFGLSTPDVVGRRMPELLAVVWDQIRPRLDRALAGERVAFELPLPSPPPGEARWFRAMYEPRADDAGNRTVVLVVVDITEQKRADAAIRESEERYRRLVEVLPAGIFVNSGGRIAFCNPGFVRLTGAADPDELLGKSPFDIFHADDHAEIRTRITTMLETGAAAQATELRVVRRDGRVVPVSSVAAPITGSDPPAVLVVLSDLSERERSTALLRSVLGSVTDTIITIDARGTVRSANPATERQFGYSEAELVGGNVNVLMPEPYHGEHDDYIANYLRTGVGKVIGVGREVTGRRKDGSTFPLELTVTEFRLDGERRFTGVVRDITARRRLEAQFQQAQKMEAVGRLAGGVAHDFNNLLTVINGYSDMVLDALPAGAPQREFVAAVREAGDRAARLTQQLLAFSRKAIIEPKILDLNELVVESAKLLRRLIGEDVALAVMPDPAPVRIKADPGQLEQVVMNLAVNARDAMPTGGRLTVETRAVTIEAEDLPAYPGVKPGRYARLRVADTGQGMTEEVKNKIFEPFFTTKGVGKGTGLGLAVVHGVVEQCGGHSAVDSAVGVGTTFTLLFPIATEATAAPASGVVRLAARGTETVLLVEDEEAVRTIARLALTTQGFTVLEAAHGADAIRLAAEHSGPIHILVTDVVMPEIGGRQLAEAVRTRRPDIRVVYMSGYTDDAVIHHGVESTDAFVQKPFTPLGLARKVRAVLDGTA